MKKPISENLLTVDESVESLKHSLERAAAYASEDGKREIEKLIAMGERFVETHNKSATRNLEATPSKLSLQVSFGCIGGIFRMLGIGVLLYPLLVLVWKFFFLDFKIALTPGLPTSSGSSRSGAGVVNHCWGKRHVSMVPQAPCHSFGMAGESSLISAFNFWARLFMACCSRSLSPAPLMAERAFASCDYFVPPFQGNASL